MRKEFDKLGSMELSDEELYGIQTKRAMDNFSLGYKGTNKNLIYAITEIKKAAAKTYKKLGIGKDGVYDAIILACNKILEKGMEKGMEKDFFRDYFPIDALQGGAGTSTNMNVNEVVANFALLEMGKKPGEYEWIHPLDDVNRGQSTNDVYPTALRMAAIRSIRKLSEECAKLQNSLQKKEQEFEDIKKLGRTELMDGVAITLGGEFGAYAQAIARDRWRIYKIEERLRQVNIGGTAVGLSDNAERKYRFKVIDELRDMTGIGLAVAEYPMDITQNNDVFVEVSGLLKALSVNLMKIANDFRWMNSGPFGGLGEIRLMPMQMGSTIMPGKINPVIPEMVVQTAIRVMANDQAISMAASHGEFELNAFLPLIADSLLESLEILEQAVKLFREKAVDTVVADKERCLSLLENSFAFATAYTTALGYDHVAKHMETYPNDPQKVKRILEEQLKESLKEQMK